MSQDFIFISKNEEKDDGEKVALLARCGDTLVENLHFMDFYSRSEMFTKIPMKEATDTSTISKIK